MSLYAILMWCLYPLAPAKRLYELTRHLLQLTIDRLSDERWIAWLRHNADDEHAFPYFERILDNLNAAIDLIIYLRARDILGLPSHDWRTPQEQQQQQPRRSRSFQDLWRGLEHCVLRFGDIDRLAAKRAQKLQRLLATPPRTADELATAAWREAATTTATSGPAAECQNSASAQPRATTATPQHSNNRIRAGVRVRARRSPTAVML